MFLGRSGPAAVILFWAAALGLAQLDTGTIMGTVVDPSGAMIPGASVKVQNMGTSATVELTTDASGNFVAPVLAIGKYRISASATGFSTYVEEGIQLSVADRVRLSIQLKPGVVTEQVTVVGSSPLIDTASSTMGDVIGAQRVVDLPLNGRDVILLVKLAPGVVGGTINGAPAFDGRLWQNGMKVLLDGGDTGQIDSDYDEAGYGSGARIHRASVDAIGEFRLASTMYSTEYGQSVGAVINYISKSGTNEFHGTVFEFFRHDKLDARNYFNPAPAAKPTIRLNQFGGVLGGPIVKNRLFFFGSYEAVRQRTGPTFNVWVPTAAFRASLPAVLQPVVAHLPLPNGPVSPSEPRLARYTTTLANQLTENAGMVKLDYLPGAKDRFTFRYNPMPSFTKSYFGVGEAQYRPVPSFLQTGKISYTRTVSPTKLNEAGFFVNRLRTDWVAAGTEAVRAFPRTSIGGGAAAIGPAQFDMPVANTSYTYMDTFSWVKDRHQLKFGAQIVRIHENKNQKFQQAVNYLNLNQFAQNRAYTVATQGRPEPGMRGTQNNVFIQDDIQASRRLTINAGVRYQFDTPPSEAYGRIANFDFAKGTVDPPGTPIWDAPKLNFAPRFGFAFTPLRSATTVIRGGFGLFYANQNPAQVQNMPNNVPGFSQARNANVSQYPNLVGFPFPDLSTFPAANTLATFDKNWEMAYTEQWNLNVQQGLGSDMVMQVAYVGNYGRHIERWEFSNPLIPGTTVRRYPNYGVINHNVPGAGSKYNGLQLSFKRRLSRGLTFNVNYTWSHMLGQGALQGGTGVQNPDNWELEWASEDYDVRHYLIFDYTYQLPHAPLLPRWVGSGWQINGITTFRTGLPINVVAGTDPMAIGSATSRPNRVPGVPMRPANYSIPNNQLNIAAFAAPPTGTWGELGRNILSGPPFAGWDFSLFKRFRVRERQDLEYRFEMFNMFNHPNFAEPGSSLAGAANFGISSSTSTSPRQLQFALKYLF